MNNGVFCKLLRSVSNPTVSFSIPSLVTDDQSNVTCPENELEKMAPFCGTDEAIPEADNNLLDQSLDAFDDQGAKTGALEVNS